MSFSVLPLLMHSEPVPATARQALRAAWHAPTDQRAAHLRSAARILHRETDLDCRDVLELVGLPEDPSCGERPAT